ncbi:unnamed protein product, partial [marine sediment metagenome]
LPVKQGLKRERFRLNFRFFAHVDKYYPLKQGLKQDLM